MVGNIEDLPRDAQQERLDEIAERLVAIVSDGGGSIATREVLTRAHEYQIARSQAKYGLTYAKSAGRISMDPATSMLSTSSRHR